MNDNIGVISSCEAAIKSMSDLVFSKNVIFDMVGVDLNPDVIFYFVHPVVFI